VRLKIDFQRGDIIDSSAEEISETEFLRLTGQKKKNEED
jgi:hypothetical protein